MSVVGCLWLGGLRRVLQHRGGERSVRGGKGVPSDWVGGVHEPETEAFGGPKDMDVAHDVSCADSRAALVEADGSGARERCILLPSVMIRSAGLDPFETGDVLDRFPFARRLWRGTSFWRSGIPGSNVMRY